MFGIPSAEYGRKVNIKFCIKEMNILILCRLRCLRGKIKEFLNN